jgi:cysteinyl-tRNA synthetase
MLFARPLPFVTPLSQIRFSTTLRITSPYAWTRFYSKKRKPPPWTPPVDTTDSVPRLAVYNTLTRRKERFIPADPKGKRVTWYSCGPTVYDAAHLGHARNYVTTDVLRRILRDYFGYDVHFVQNITDVDDKIILRTRQQFLLHEFKGKHLKITPKVLAELEKAWDAYLKQHFADYLQGKRIKPRDFEIWVKTDYPQLFSPDAKLDEAAVKLKMRYKIILPVADALSSEVSSVNDLYDAVLPVLQPFLDDVNKDRELPSEVFMEFTSRMEQHFDEDMAKLNVLPPTTTVRVSEFIPENVQFIERLVKKGFAYPTNDGSVYFDIAAYEAAGHSYARLQPGGRSDEELIASKESTLSPGAKKGAHDFALWKASKPGEPSWESPWGPGRPGWHTECSVMCSNVLGDSVDIHSGGIDLAFPHHDNELAQSEAYWDECCPRPTTNNRHQWVNYFLHTGHLQIQGSKMSKSLKNFITIRSAFETTEWTPRRLRIAFLLTAWNSRLELQADLLAEAKSFELTLSNFLTRMIALTSEQQAREASGFTTPHPWTGLESEFLNQFTSAQRTVHAALCDSFNTPLAMRTLTELVSAANRYLSKSPPISSISLPLEVSRWITHLTGTAFGLQWRSSDGMGIEDKAMPFVHLLSSFRDQVRAACLTDTKSPVSKQLLNACDHLRNNLLPDLGVVLDDRPGGQSSLVKVMSPEEVAERKAEKETKEARGKHLEDVEMVMLQAVGTHPRDMFRTPHFSEWDENGLPVKDAQGDLIGRVRKKVYLRWWNRRKTEWERFTGREI